MTPRCTSLILATLAALCAPAAHAGPPGPGAGRRPTAAVLSVDASVVAAQVAGKIHVWDRASGRRLASLASGQFFRGAVTPGALVVVGDRGVQVHRGPGYRKLVRLPTPKLLSTGRTAISAHGRVAAAFYPGDGGVGDPDTVRVWDARRGKVRATLRLKRGARVQGIVLSRDGGTLVVFGDRQRKMALLQVYRLRGRRASVLLSWRSAEDRTTFSAALSGDGRLLALGAGRRVLLWDLAATRAGKLKPPRQTPTAAIKALFPPALRGPAVRMPGAHQLAFSADGKQLASLHAFGVVGLARWRVADLQPTAWIKRPRDGGTQRGVAWDSKGELWLISATYSPTVWVHRPVDGRFKTVRALAGP